MVKQIRNDEVVGKIIDQGNGYFHWLQRVSGLSGPLSSMLADTEFVSVNDIDDVIEKKAKEEIRRKYADDITEKENLDDKETETLLKSIRGNCCLFEVIVCLAYSINEMFEDLDAYDGCAHFFNILMENAGFNQYDEEDYDMHTEKVKEYWEHIIEVLVGRKYREDGFGGGLFPLDKRSLRPNNEGPYSDRRKVSLWQQMNDWVDQHTNEDGEWVD